MTGSLEDILGGVEDEIRQAEERLQLGAFRVDRTAGKVAGRPGDRFPFDEENNDDNFSEGVEPTSRARGLGSRITSRWRGTGPINSSELSTSGVLSTGKTLLKKYDSTIRRPRRRAWADLESDGLPSSISSGGGGGGVGTSSERHGGGSNSAKDREAMVNRLLRERDARLAAAIGSDAATPATRSNGGGGRDEQRGSVVAAGSRGYYGVVTAIPDESCSSATNEEVGGDGGGGGGDGGPSNSRGDIFFASDLLQPGDTDDDNGPNGYSAVGTPTADKAVEALLLRLRGDDDGGTDADADHAYCYDGTHSNGVSRDEVDSHRLRWIEEGVALMRPPPPPPSPPPALGPNGLSSPGLPHAGRAAGCCVPDEGLGHSQPRRRDSPECRIVAGRKGRCRSEERGRPTSGGSSSSSSSSSYRLGDENDAVATARLEDQLAFRPGTNTRSSLQRSGNKQRATGERRIEELARNRQAIYFDRERRRKELQEVAETKECTFRPNIAASVAAGWGAGAAEAGGGGYDDSDGAAGAGRPPLHERLHKEAREREAARALAHYHLEKEALRECTFQPTLIAAGACAGATGQAAAAEQRPLHLRVWEVEREREHNLRLLVADKEEREGATFAPPPLGRVSEKLAARDVRTAAAAAVGGGGAWEESGGRGREVGRLLTRLQEQAMWARERRRLRVQEHEEAEARMSTFEPSISRGTKSLVRKRPDLQAPFEQRQAIMESKRQGRERLRQAARNKEETRWFNPATARRTDALLRRRRPQRLEETVEERVKRMAGAEDQRRRDYVMAQRAKERFECTFRPSLNPVTQSMGQAAPLDELVNNRRGQRVRERAQAKARDAQMCSHKPVLVAEAALLQARTEGGAAAAPTCRGGGSGGGGGDGGNGSGGRGGVAADLYGPGNRYRLSVREPARMMAELQARERQQEERSNAVREEKEVAEMQRCTFIPQTNPAILRARGPVLVRGLGRHLELKDVAQQMEHDRREREAQAFGVRPGAVRRTAMGETVVEPFKLSSDTKGWWEERKKRHEVERAAQCTFKPWTVEAERGRALSRLLNWSSVLSSESSRC